MKQLLEDRSVTFINEGEYIFDNSNVLDLVDRVSPKDRDDFFIDIRKVDFMQECRSFIMG